MKARLALWLGVAAGVGAAEWPNGPLRTSGRRITDASGERVTHVGVNWPAHGEAMIPEGLQYQPIAAIVSKIRSLGMNAIRLTYAVQMVDQIYDSGGEDVTIEKALADALGRENGTAVLRRIIENNPSFSPATTRLEVFDAVAAECAKQQVYILLDNHVSRAGWCCNPFDGNSWWGDKYFSAANWTRGLAYMAEHGKSWPALTSMSLRNELRQPLTDIDLYREHYNWQTWYNYTRQGAAAIHAANGDVLVLLSGMDSATRLDAVVHGRPLAPGNDTFSASDFPPTAADKLALELHSYATLLPSDAPRDGCASLREKLLRSGFGDTLASADGSSSSSSSSSSSGTRTPQNRLPLLLTEWGFAQDATTWNTSAYATCLRAFLPGQRAGGWFLWVLAGSYYVREGSHDHDEPWGLLTHDWAAWRSPAFVEGGLRPMVEETFAAVRGMENLEGRQLGTGIRVLLG